jgi:serine/threonine protein kinase
MAETVKSLGDVEALPDRALCGGRYPIVGRIATGGMAEVFEGEDTVLGRRVAIKVMKRAPAEGARGEGAGEGEADEREIEAAHAADRMRVEARALALVAHPNVVAAFDFGLTTDERPFLVTEHLSGRALDAELRERGHLPWEEAASVVGQVLAALEAVHEKGIVHRDVKPGNVFLCAGGRVKLLDFGVAKILGDASVKHVAPAYRTKKGSMVGTPRYMTPEQARGEAVDARTDLYAVGLLLYSLITGWHALAGSGAGDVVEMVKTMRDRGPEAPSARAPQPIPAALDRIVLKALSWEAAARFQSAAAFARALRDVLPAAPARPTSEASAEGASEGETLEDPCEDLDEPTHVMPQDQGLPRAALAIVLVVAAALSFWLSLLAGGAG